VAYGSTNKYRPVNRSKASGNTAKRPTLEVYFPCPTAMMLTMTATVKAMHTQRWVCPTHLFQFNGTSSIVLRSTSIHASCAGSHGQCRSDRGPLLKSQKRPRSQRQ